MTTYDPKMEPSTRRAFKYLNIFMVLMWRLGLGKLLNFWPSQLGRYMVIMHTGRKSGLRRYTPVNYALVNEEIYCTAAFGNLSDWYHNMIANPAIEVWLPDGWWNGIAEDITGDPNFLPLMRKVLAASGFAARSIGIDAEKISDTALTHATSGYRLVHIRRTAARTGPGGPGELAWLWPLSTFFLGFMLLFRPRKR